MAAKNQAKSFSATLERMPGNLGWTIVRIPFDVGKLWGKSGHVRVQGEINGFVFSTALFPTRSGQHFMLVNKKMQKGARVQPGVSARFAIELDTADRPAPHSHGLEQVLKQSKRLTKFYGSLSKGQRRYIALWVEEPKSTESRRRRAEQMAERLMATMEAERQLPPVIELALRENPRAREGWRRMTPLQRRSELMGIFGYQSPESRAKRIAKAIEVMLKHAGEKQQREDHKRGRALLERDESESILEELERRLRSLDSPD